MKKLREAWYVFSFRAIARVSAALIYSSTSSRKSSTRSNGFACSFWV